MKAKTLLSLAGLSLSGIAFGATTQFYFSQDANNIEYWDALAEDTSYGAFMLNNPYTNYCDSFGVNGSGKDVSLKITGEFFTNYPLHTGGATYTHLQDLTLVIDSGATFASSLSINLKNNTALIMKGGDTFKGDLTLTDANSISSVTISDGAVLDNGGRTRIGSTSGEQTFTVIGADATVNLRNFALIGDASTTADNVVGGKIVMKADASGMGTITTYGTNNNDFSGVLVADFTNIVWDESWGDRKTFTLISCSDNTFEALFAAWLSNSDLGDVIGASNGVFSVDNRNIYVTVDRVIPEPGTYAAIFGALALAFAAYRRRK